MMFNKFVGVFLVLCIGLVAEAQIYGEQIKTCASLAEFGLSSSASQCNSAIVGKYLSPAADDVCNSLARSGLGSSAVQCIQGAADAQFDDVGLSACKSLARLGLGSSAAQCVATLRNKRLDQRIVGTCLQSAQNGMGSSTVSCLSNCIIGELGAGYPQPNPQPWPQPVPPPTNGCYPNYKDQQILDLVNRGKQAVTSGNSKATMRILNRIELLLRSQSYR
jgi:hypothetical protein